MITTKILMWACAVSLFHLLTLIIITCNSIPIVLSAPTQKDIEMDLLSFQRSQEFKCDKPQLRAYNLLDLMIYHGYSIRNEIPEKPPYIVVYRCDGHAGCCSVSNKICMVIDDSIYYEKLDFEFSVMGSTKRKKKTISIQHHGNCSCTVADHAEREDMENIRPTIKFV